MTTDFGFRWGPLEIVRQVSDPRYGYVLEVKTPHGRVEISCTPTGRNLTARGGPYSNKKAKPAP